ncbi:MAG TPA: metallophosphoesterase [Pyrinomonadaceae bacterium]|nr:metallophosphoesterase [Pyrinomonadaceae bacterium]
METQRLIRIVRIPAKLLMMLALFLPLAGHQVIAAPPDGQVADIQAILVGGEAQTEAANLAQVEIKHGATGKTEVGRVGMRLVVGDEITTGGDAEVSLIFSKPNSDQRIEVFVLQRSKAAISSLYSFYGSFLISGWGIFDTRTRYVRLGKRGTEFQIDVDAKRGTVDLTVFRGVVDLQQGVFAPPAGHAAVLTDQFIDAGYQPSASSPPPSTAVVEGLHKVRIEKNVRIPKPQLLEASEVVSYVQRTNYLYIATMPARPPADIRPTTYTAVRDPVENKRLAAEALTKARIDAILHPDAENTRRLGEAYKDFGAGQRSTTEFNKATKLEPGLVNDPSFLISRSEAYRLSGDLAESDRQRTAAANRIGKADILKSTDLNIASRNLNHDKANASLARDESGKASTHLPESRTQPLARTEATAQAATANVPLPMREGSLRMAVFGNSGSGTKAQYDLGGVMEEYRKIVGFDWVLLTGNNIYGADKPADMRDKFELPYKSLLDGGVKFYASLGNHDSSSQRHYAPFNMNGEEYYRIERAGVSFYALNSTYLDKRQLDWLVEQLSKDQNAWRVAFFSHPPYSSGPRRGSSAVLEVLHPLFVKYGIDVVFNGHDQFYERVKPQDGITYFIAGGASKIQKGALKEGSPIIAAGFDTDLSFMLIEFVGDDMYFQTISGARNTVDSGVVRRRDKF